MMKPTPFIIKVARLSAGLTQAEAAKLVHLSAQPIWADYEAGKYPPDKARWELFLILTGQHPNWHKLRPKKPIKAEAATTPPHEPPIPA